MKVEPQLDVPADELPERYEDDETLPSVRVGGRKSKLAVFQSQWVADKLRRVHPGLSFPVIAVSTLGDNVQSKPLYSFGGKALWTKELEQLLLSEEGLADRVDMIVHSLKDMPTHLPEGCTLGAITEREDPRDALCLRENSPYRTLADFPDGAVVGTSSIRRSAQLRRRYPNLKFENIRGNIQTRIQKCNSPDTNYDGIILAAAGLKRVGLERYITCYLEPPEMFYAVGQGALGVEIRSGDERVKKLVARINHTPTDLRCRAERSLMRTLEGGCSVPIGVDSNYTIETGILSLTGIIVSVDGSQAVESTVSSKVYSQEEADQLGKDLAYDLIAKGAKRILDAIDLDRIN